MKYAVIVWKTCGDGDGNGEVYLWCESIATALNTAVDLMRAGVVGKAVAVKLL